MTHTCAASKPGTFVQNYGVVKWGISSRFPLIYGRHRLERRLGGPRRAVKSEGLAYRLACDHTVP